MRKASSVSKGHLYAASALCGVLPAVAFQPAWAAEPAPAVQEVVVTATRRAEDVTKIPYNIAVVGSDQLQKTGVTNIEDLSRQVPNLVVTSSGNRYLGAQRQIMRGLNASVADRRGVAIEQNAVSTYLDNAPYANFFPVKDISRVEVLRGPQGTLYGAGALGGAIRLITNAPALGKFEGSLSASSGLVSHSRDKDYSAEGVINIPIGETLAARLSASEEYNAGYIDQFGAFVTAGNVPLGEPQLAHPLDPLHSSAVRVNLKDVNWDKTTFWRASLKWQPTAAFSAVLAYNFVRTNGYGPSSDNPHFHGGTDPFDPTVTLPATGEYQIDQRVREPFHRRSEMATLDLSYDAGFATVSSTSSYFTTRGEAYYDATLGTAALPPAYVAYYVGNPVNPRYNAPEVFADHNNVFTQEVRMVSNGGKTFDYVVGAFYQKESRTDLWNGYTPGQYVYNQTPGVSTPGGVGPDNRNFTVGGSQEFTDKSIFGDLTWHATPQLDITVGARLFEQTISRIGVSDIPTFFLSERNANSVKFKDHSLKANVSYAYRPDHQVYATFSQGFRRGGANAFALSGFLFEPIAILDYKPDTVDNYEAGLKGRFEGGWRYTVDGFFDQWHNPQIGGFTPYNVWPVTVNGKEAESKGVELELSGPLISDLSFSVGYSFTEAKLTQDFCLPAGVGDGVNTDPCAIRGIAGTTLPSAPKNSATLTLNYRHELSGGDVLAASLNTNYKSAMRQNIPTNNQRYPLIPGYSLTNLNLSWEHGPWTASAYARNVFDKRVIYSTYARVTPFVPLDLADTIGRPRTVGLSLRYSW